MALSYPETVEMPHFEKLSYRIKKGKIFATLDASGQIACLKLTEIDQSIFSGIDPKLFTR
ncbi:MAG: MmcQ/YjbR family DNA-binding protein [Ferruginibacter sp.]